MYHENIRPSPIEGLETMAFSDRVMRLSAGRSDPPLPIRAATLTEALEALSYARNRLGELVPNHVVEAVLEHNPELVQLVGTCNTEAAPNFLAFLPLNAAGARAIIQGRFSGKQPDLDLVCRPSESLTAIYIWLIHAPLALGPALRALAPLLRRLAPDGCPLFTRAATGHTARLFPAMGFLSANDAYTNAAADLLVLPPRGGLPAMGQASRTASACSRSPERSPIRPTPGLPNGSTC
ncbi:hypothetical protein [Sphingobium lactosutens]|uniref:hypothetical protein n=1 Tax=Sphingobium lactosutens TaxID=522773 RepID=UPI0021174667|nr:hypothetical protein [Sphingobium lactosutens]